ARLAATPSGASARRIPSRIAALRKGEQRESSQVRGAALCRGAWASRVAPMLEKLDREERLRLMRFVCSFVWADLRIRDKERVFVRNLVKKLKLSADDAKLVEEWLKVPPKPEDIDPATIPRAHWKLFLDTARAAIASDGEIDPEEQLNLQLL